MSKKFLVHDKTRGHVGNSMVWWAKDHRGYTCDVNQAHRFTELEAIRVCEEADDLVAYPEKVIAELAVPHCTAFCAQLKEHVLVESDTL